jgi:hypothetical protein
MNSLPRTGPGLEALRRHYDPPFFTRIGLRYRDVVRRSRLQLAEMPWSELLQPWISSVLAMPEAAKHIQGVQTQFVLNLPEETCGPTPSPLSEKSGPGEPEQHRFSPPWNQPGEDLLAAYGFYLSGTSNRVEWLERIFKRLLCQALLQQLPDEAVESLSHRNAFYRLPRSVPPPQPPRQSIPVQMGKGYVRPVFPVTEEE